MSSKMIGKLTLNNELLQHDLDTIAQFPILEEEYAEFGIGSWKNHSLWNIDGDYKNTQYSDYSTFPKITELGGRLPYITKMIKENFDITHLKMVRARNLVNGFVIPHKDFVELNQNKKNYLRIFIPLENNKNAYHSDENSVFQMQKGEIWKLDASIVHAAANFAEESRVNLCLDFQFTETTAPETIFLDKNVAATTVAPTIPTRKSFSELNLNLKLNDYAKNVNKNNLLKTLVDLSKIHFEYDANIVDCYDWLLCVAEKSRSEEVLKKCKVLKRFMIEKRDLGERFIF